MLEDNLYDPNVDRGVFYFSNTSLSNAYDGNINNLGGYISGEFAFTDKIKAIVGGRVENYNQYYTGRNQAANTPDNPDGIIYDNENVLSSTKFFPSASLNLATSELSNLRLSYAKTIARPSFKEKSNVEIIDVISGRGFVGNIDLIETDIQNYDIRWEGFWERAQTISIGAFYKTFRNPIELVRQTADVTQIRPENVGDAYIVGVELETRKDFNFISPFMQRFSLVTNLTLTQAEVERNAEELAGKEEFLKEGEELETKRDFVGQAPYILNTSINYVDFESGLEGSIAYNVQGSTLAVVGANRAPDTYTVPFNSLNFTLSKRFGEGQRNKIGAKVTNILDDDKEQIFTSFRSDDFLEYFRSPGRTFGLSYSRTF